MPVTLELGKSVFNEVYWPYLDATQRIQIFFGGSSSGKSVFLSDRCIRDILKGLRNYLVIRNVSSTIKTSVFNELKKSIRKFKVNHLFKINKSDLTITCVNGKQIICKGLDDPEKLKSITPEDGVITDIWVEEATETMFEAIKQLRKRLRGVSKVAKRFIFSFNPIYKTHWLFKNFFSPNNFSDKDTIFENEKILILKTTYKDNKFLEKDDIAELEDETDKYYYEVYSLGNWGILGDLIFTNWEIAEFDDIEHTFDKFHHGLDFGFSNHPTAYNKSYYHEALQTIYITDEYHELGVTNQEIAKGIKELADGDTVICDSAEPKSIKELNNEGLRAEGAEKGKDSVNFGIQWLQRQKIVVHPRCQETINEFQLYQWKVNKNGEKLNEPVKKNDHHMDDIRYSYEEYALTGGDLEVGVGDALEEYDEEW